MTLTSSTRLERRGGTVVNCRSGSVDRAHQESASGLKLAVGHPGGGSACISDSRSTKVDTGLRALHHYKSVGADEENKRQ